MTKAPQDISRPSIRSSRSKRKPGKQAAIIAKPKRKPAGKGLLSEAKIREVFRRFHAADPEPKGELQYVNPFTLLVAVVLSAQATDAGVNKATAALFKIADTPKKMLALGEEKLRDHIKTIGLYRNKAKNVIALSKRLVDEFDSQVPGNRDTLETLPGVGRKTANVVMNIAFGHPTMAVDTHVFRVANRLGLSHGTTPLAVEEDLLRVIPPEYALHAHHWLILHGRYVCKARRPECWRCLVSDLCPYPDKTPAP
jgi:endonuclease-3